MALIGSLKRRLRTDRRKVAPRAKAWPCQFLMIPMIIAALAGCNPFDRGSSWHQRLVLEVETPEGVVSGGSVVAVRIWKSWALGFSGPMLGSDITGEASFVEVAPGQYLFALLDNGTLGLPLKLFFSDPKPSVWERAEMLESMRGEVIVVPPDQYPQLVTFGDINDPTSVQSVDATNLAASFGAGVKLRGNRVDINRDDAISKRLEYLLPWLRWNREDFLSAGNGTNPLKIEDESPRGYSTIGRINFVWSAR